MKIGSWKSRGVVLGALGVAYLVMWIGGVGSYVFLGRPPLDAPWAASVFLLLAGLLVIAGSNGRELPALFLAAAIGFVSEIIGVYTGALYGHYFYTDVLQPQVFGVPVVMICAWMTLVSYCREILNRLSLPRWMQVLIGAGWMTAIDLIIDPLAAHQLGYWRWMQPGNYYGIPAKNFAGWFLVSLIIFICFRLQPRQRLNTVSEWVGLSIVLFFTIIAFALGYLIPGVVGVVLCMVHGWLVWKDLSISRRK